MFEVAPSLVNAKEEAVEFGSVGPAPRNEGTKVKEVWQKLSLEGA